LLNPYQLPAHVSLRPMLSHRLPRTGVVLPNCAAENRLPVRSCRKMCRGTKSTCGDRDSLSGMLHIGRDARGRGSDSNVRYPTEGSSWEPVYSAG
jgi:hypothetical protein